MKLAEYLNRLGLTATEFSNHSGVARATIIHILNGGSCHAKAAKKIITATHGLVTLDDLIDGGEPPGAASA